MATITINQKFDIPETLYQEYVRYSELATEENRTTTGALDFTNTTTGVPYNSTTGEEGLLTLLEAALDDYKINASEWNLFQTETDDALDDLITATYGVTTDQSAVRDTDLTGLNIDGALTQITSGESAITANGELGIFKDSDNDGIADGVTLLRHQNEAVLNDSALYGFSQYAESDASFATDSPIIAEQFSTPSGLSIGDILYYVGYVKIADITDATFLNIIARESIGGSALTVEDTIAVDSSYEDWVKVFGTLAVSVATVLTSIVLRFSTDLSGVIAGSPLQTSNFSIINLTDKYGGGSEPTEAQAKLNFPTPFINIGNATINQKNTGANGEFELNEPYVLPKTKDGTITTIINKDGQNYVRPAHKQEIFNGGLAWTGFTTSGSVIYAYVDDISEEEFLSLTLNSGDFVNNDFNFRMATSISTTLNSATYNVTNSRLTLGILQSFAGTTQATYEAYLNSSPVKSSIALALAEYNTGLLDIPIKHLGSIEDGTITNNSTILPSAITYTYPTNEAAVRESSQIAQNQITTVESHIVEQDTSTIFSADTIDTQGIYTTPIKTIFSDTIDTFLSTSKITTEFIGGNIKTTITEV